MNKSVITEFGITLLNVCLLRYPGALQAASTYSEALSPTPTQSVNQQYIYELKGSDLNNDGIRDGVASAIEDLHQTNYHRSVLRLGAAAMQRAILSTVDDQLYHIAYTTELIESFKVCLTEHTTLRELQLNTTERRSAYSAFTRESKEYTPTNIVTLRVYSATLEKRLQVTTINETNG